MPISWLLAISQSVESTLPDRLPGASVVVSQREQSFQDNNKLMNCFQGQIFRVKFWEYCPRGSGREEYYEFHYSHV